MFETEHLIIREFTENDAQDLYENHLEEEVKHWIPNETYQDPEEALDAIGFYRNCVKKKCLPCVLAVEEKQTGALIGDTGVNQVEGSSTEVEIGYTICSRCSGNGYATEAVKAMTAYAAAVFGVKTLYGRVLRGNHASIRVLEKNGFHLVREERGAKDDPYGKGMLVYKKSLG